MAKLAKKPRSKLESDVVEKTPPAPSFYGTTSYKLWARSRLVTLRARDGEQEWTLKKIASKLKRIDPNAKATDGSVGLLLGADGSTPQPSNTTLMPALNKLLGASPPPVCDPNDPIAQLRDALAARWPQLTKSERRALEAIAKGEAEDDES